MFDLWAESRRKRKMKGDVIVVRYADDFVVGFQLNPFMDTPRVKRFSIGCERVIGCSHLSGLKGAAI